MNQGHDMVNSTGTLGTGMPYVSSEEFRKRLSLRNISSLSIWLISLWMWWCKLLSSVVITSLHGQIDREDTSVRLCILMELTPTVLRSNLKTRLWK
ncbi:hypothetical protein MHYP_G00010180 [Metynnis hypsauchen]